MEVTVIHTETIKPSTPTPTHKKFLRLSLLDQIVQSHFVPFVYFYQCNHSDSIRSTLKKSLADTLTWYYPLAGRVKGTTHVECNDEGVPYFETQVTGNLKEVAEQRNYAVVNSMCPFSDNLEDTGDVALAVQVNFFACGGIAIGVCVNHAIGDALSMLTFVKFWGAVARGDHKSMASPQFGLDTIFPSRGSMESEKGYGNSKEKNIVGKSFLFTKSSISALKTKYGARTTAEALMTFILTRLISITSQKRELIGCLPLVPVNLRTRLIPPLPESHCGNVIRVVGTYVSSKDGNSMSIQEEAGYGSLTKIRIAIGKASSEAIKELQEGDTKVGPVKIVTDSAMLEIFRAKKEMQLIPLVFSSLSKFPAYDIDFGWGRPIWVTLGIIGVNKMFIFMPAQCGDGIEVQVFAGKDDLKIFETDKEFLLFATIIGNRKVPVPSSL